MKEFLAKICIFFSIFIISVIIVFGFHYCVIGNQREGSYSAAIVDKVNRLNSIDEPKIILVGDSNVCFGMNSEKLEEALGMPVVNMGLHGALGNAFHEEMAKAGIKEGDIVIVCHSNYNDNDNIINSLVAWDTIEMNSNLWYCIRPKDIPGMIKAYPAYLKTSIIYWSIPGHDYVGDATTSYERRSFNEFGDIVIRGDSRYAFDYGGCPVPEISDKCIDRLNRYNEYINARGATLLIAGYPIGSGEYTPESERFNEFEEQLRSRLDCEVISHFTDYFIPYEYFYDTNLHLLDEGVEMRTNQLLVDIQNWKSRQ